MRRSPGWLITQTIQIPNWPNEVEASKIFRCPWDHHPFLAIPLCASSIHRAQWVVRGARVQGHLGHLGVSLTSPPCSASLTPSSQNKVGKQSPCWAPRPRLPPNQGNVCFLRKYKHRVLCAGAHRALLAVLQVPPILRACYTTQGASRASSH